MSFSNPKLLIMIGVVIVLLIGFICIFAACHLMPVYHKNVKNKKHKSLFRMTSLLLVLLMLFGAVLYTRDNIINPDIDDTEDVDDRTGDFEGGYSDDDQLYIDEDGFYVADDYVKLSDVVSNTLGITDKTAKSTVFVAGKNSDNIPDILYENGATHVSRFKKNAFHKDESVFIGVFDDIDTMKLAESKLSDFDVTFSDADGEVELSYASNDLVFDYEDSDKEIIDIPSNAGIDDPSKHVYKYPIYLYDTGLDKDDAIGHGSLMRNVIRMESYYADIESYNVFGNNDTVNASALAASLLYGSNGTLGVYNISMSGYGHSNALKYAIDKLVKSYNGSVVVAAGNNADDARFYAPANISSAITVGAYDKNTGKLADYSNYGDCIDYICDGEFFGEKGTSIAAARMSSYIEWILDNNIPCDDVTDVLDMLAEDVDGYKYICVTEDEVADACDKYKKMINDQYHVDIESMFTGCYDEVYGAQYNLMSSDKMYGYFIDKENVKLIPASDRNNGGTIIYNRPITIFNIPKPYATKTEGNAIKINQEHMSLLLVAFRDLYHTQHNYSFSSAKSDRNLDIKCTEGYKGRDDVFCHTYTSTNIFNSNSSEAVLKFRDLYNGSVNLMYDKEKTDYPIGNGDFKTKTTHGTKRIAFKYLQLNGKESTTPGPYPLNAYPEVKESWVHKQYGYKSNLENVYNSINYRIDRYCYVSFKINDITVGGSGTYTPYIFMKLNLSEKSVKNVYGFDGLGFDRYLYTSGDISYKPGGIFPYVEQYEIQKPDRESFVYIDDKTRKKTHGSEKTKYDSIHKLSLEDISKYLHVENKTGAPHYDINTFRSRGQNDSILDGNGLITIYEGCGGISNEIYLYPGRHQIVYTIGKATNGDDTKKSDGSNVITQKLAEHISSQTISSATARVLLVRSISYVIANSNNTKKPSENALNHRCIYIFDRGNNTFYNSWTYGFSNADWTKITVPKDDKIYIKHTTMEHASDSKKINSSSYTSSLNIDLTGLKKYSDMIKGFEIPESLIHNNGFNFVALFEDDMCRFVYKREPESTSDETDKETANDTKQMGLIAAATYYANKEEPPITEMIQKQQEAEDKRYAAACAACAMAQGPCDPGPHHNILEEWLEAYNDSHDEISGYSKTGHADVPNVGSVWEACFHDGYEMYLKKIQSLNSHFKGDDNNYPGIPYTEAIKDKTPFASDGGGEHKITYDPNGGVCLTKSITVSDGIQTNITGNYASSGKADCKTIKPPLSSEVHCPADAAQYLVNKYGPKEVDNTLRDRVVTSLLLSVNDGTHILPDAYRDGYIFRGWYNGSDFYGNAGDKKTMGKDERKSIHLVARWEPIQFRVLYVTNIPIDDDSSTNLSGIESHTTSTNLTPVGDLKSYRAAEQNGDTGGQSTVTCSSDPSTNYTTNPNDKYYSYVGKTVYTYDGVNWDLDPLEITVNDMYFTGWTYYDILWNGAYSSYNSDDDDKTSDTESGEFISDISLGDALELEVDSDGDVFELTERTGDSVGTSMDDCYDTSKDCSYKKLTMIKNPFANHMNNQPCLAHPDDKGYTNASKDPSCSYSKATPKFDQTNKKPQGDINQNPNLYLVLKANWSSSLDPVSITYHSNNDKNLTSHDIWNMVDLTNYRDVLSITESDFASDGFGKDYTGYSTYGTATNVRLLNATDLTNNDTGAFLSGKSALGDDGSYDGSTTSDQFVVNTSDHSRYYFGKSNGRTGFFSFQGWSPWKFANWRDSIDNTKHDSGASYSYSNEYQPNGHDNIQTKKTTTTGNNGIPVVTRYNDAARSKRVGDLFYRYGVTTLSHDLMFNGSLNNKNLSSDYMSGHTYALSSEIYNAFHWRWTQGTTGNYSEFINLIKNPRLDFYEIWDCYPTTDIQNVYVYTNDEDDDDDLEKLTPQYLFSKVVAYDYEDFESLGSSRSLGDSGHTWSANATPSSGMTSRNAGSYSYTYNLSQDSGSLGYMDGKFTATLLNYDYQAFRDAKTSAINNVNEQLKHLMQGGGTANDIQSVALTWQFEDSAGNITYHTSWVYIIDRESVSVLDPNDSNDPNDPDHSGSNGLGDGDTDDTRYAVTRFIDDESYFGDGSDKFMTGPNSYVNDDESTGGVQYRSKWKLSPAYVSELTDSLARLEMIGNSKLTLGDFVQDQNNDGIMDTWGVHVGWSGDYHPQNNGDGTWEYPWSNLASQCDGIYQLDYNDIVKTKKFVHNTFDGGSGDAPANYGVTDHSALQRYIDTILKNTAKKRIHD